MKYNDFAISSKLPANSHLRPYSRMKGTTVRSADPPAERRRRFDIEPYERMSLIWKIVISRWILDISLCRICIHTLARSSRGRLLCRRRGHNAVAHAISSHSSPFSALHEWHGNRLSITHAHSHERESKTSSSRVARTQATMHTGGVGGEVQLWMQPSHYTFHSYEKSRMLGHGGDLRLRPSRERLLLAWPMAKTTWPTTRARARIRSLRRTSHVRQVIKRCAQWHTWRVSRIMRFLAKLTVGLT